MENNYLFVKNFAWCKMIDQNLKKIKKKEELNTSLVLSIFSYFSSSWEMLVWLQYFFF
jgi:hypothetical protein